MLTELMLVDRIYDVLFDEQQNKEKKYMAVNYRFQQVIDSLNVKSIEQQSSIE